MYVVDYLVYFYETVNFPIDEFKNKQTNNGNQVYTFFGVPVDSIWKPLVNNPILSTSSVSSILINLLPIEFL